MGAVAPLKGTPGYYEFEYQPEFVRAGLELSPLLMPSAVGTRYRFPGLSVDTFQGLPGLLADSLPDKFGNALITEDLTRHGTSPTGITTLQRLIYVGKRAMGALEFEPALAETRGRDVAIPLQMATLVEDARRALRGDTAHVTQDMIDIGSSAGGARAKALIGWNPTTNQVVSGQFELPEGFEHWLLKFDVGEDRVLGHPAGFGRIEFAHHRMATEAGVDMCPARLLEEGGRAHFMTRRFDREGNTKLHLHSLCGLLHLDFNAPFVHGYEQYLRTVLEMRLGAQAVEQAWLRCAFNIAAVNCDDHTKNLAFLMDADGRWSLSPAYDVCFSHNPRAARWTRQHQMLVNGKAWGITADDLLTVASDFSINQPRHLLTRVVDSIARWKEFAKETDVSKGDIDRIAAHQRSANIKVPGASGQQRPRGQGRA